MQLHEFIQVLRRSKFDNVFNPYGDRCELHDLGDAPARRSKALLDLMTAASHAEVDSVWIGRDLGYRGGRRTGLALTDDLHVESHGARWGVSIERATAGPMMAERTAAVIWKTISHIGRPIFLWNVFPFHPYESNDPFTNRAHNSNERAFGESLLSELLSLLGPTRVVALGKDAAAVAGRVAGAREVVHVRHPSYGGQTEFTRQIQALYDLRI